MERAAAFDTHSDRDARTRSDDRKPRERKDFELTLVAPFGYANTSVRASTDDPVDTKGDWYASPDVSLKWSRRDSWVRLSASVGATLDRYLSEDSTGAETVYGTLKATFTDGSSDLLIPYVSYARTSDFQAGYRTRDSSFDDIAAGISSSFAWRPGGPAIRYKDAIEPGDISLRIGLRAGYRSAEYTDQQYTSAALTLDLSYVLTDEWAFDLTPAIRVRWYNDYFEQPRRDIRTGLTLKATWTPDWLTEQQPDAKIEFQIKLQRNVSTVPEQSYRLWDVGPALVYSQRF
jgi:hypothetical protein